MSPRLDWQGKRGQPPEATSLASNCTAIVAFSRYPGTQGTKSQEA
jgi:hypothetical protein